MAVKVAINGFGRIGRLVLRAAWRHGRNDIEFVAINDLGSVETNAHLLHYDTVHGRFPGEVIVDGDRITIRIDGKTWARSRSRPSAIRPSCRTDLGVDVVFECTGIFTSKDKAAVHLDAGARKVLVSAPSKAPTRPSSMASTTRR